MSRLQSIRIGELATAAVIAILFIRVFTHTAYAQIWDCSGQYTNHPEGKGRCQPAGGVTSCGSDGNRYFSPRRNAEAPAIALCNATGTGRSPFVDMHQQRLAQFGGTGIHEKLVAPAQVPQASKEMKRESPEKIDQIPSSSIEDLFSCFSNPNKLAACFPDGLGRFVEKTFVSASKALQ